MACAPHIDEVFLVRVTRFELVRRYQQGIFLLLYVTIAALLRCSLEYVFTISFLT